MARIDGSDTKKTGAVGPQVKQPASLNLCLYLGLQDLWQTGATGQTWTEREAAWLKEKPDAPFRVPWATDCPR
jgi:hypothetical protein